MQIQVVCTEANFGVVTKDEGKTCVSSEAKFRRKKINTITLITESKQIHMRTIKNAKLKGHSLARIIFSN